MLLDMDTGGGTWIAVFPPPKLSLHINTVVTVRQGRGLGVYMGVEGSAYNDCDVEKRLHSWRISNTHKYISFCTEK
ncbi:hypothetical protein EYF80_006923 [Liparis tanakae]|uniref:Uncharacterized protein n=1 Tax=Liparis tanakae TaxID=230148 RepID=A0A4Z2IYK6_9TELE|nr:hypothetical protein EYF80_006923 [Liparis tanakae]